MEEILIKLSPNLFIWFSCFLSSSPSSSFLLLLLSLSLSVVNRHCGRKKNNGELIIASKQWLLDVFSYVLIKFLFAFDLFDVSFLARSPRSSILSTFADRGSCFARKDNKVVWFRGNGLFNNGGGTMKKMLCINVLMLNLKNNRKGDIHCAEELVLVARVVISWPLIINLINDMEMELILLCVIAVSPIFNNLCNIG